jgi:hypothetical protein
MNKTLENLTNKTLDKLKSKLSTEEIPIEIFFEYEDKIVIFSVQEYDEGLSLSVGVNQQGTDLMYSNFILFGTSDEVSAKILDKTTVEKILNCIDNLLLKFSKE